MVSKWASGAVGAGLMLASQSAALAGPYSDDLSKCLVAHTNQTDEIALIRWFFSILALNPEIKSITAISDQQRDVINHQIATLFDRLLVSDCRVQTVQALKYEGQDAMNSSFKTMGEVATRSLMTSPSVGTGAGVFTKYLDVTEIQKLYSEAGLSAPGVNSKPK